jgi:hypothetical protein
MLTDVNGALIKDGTHVKYSYNEIRIPVFTGLVISKDGELYIEHTNKVTVKVDDSFKYIEVISR